MPARRPRIAIRPNVGRSPRDVGSTQTSTRDIAQGQGAQQMDIAQEQNSKQKDTRSEHNSQETDLVQVTSITNDSNLDQPTEDVKDLKDKEQTDITSTATEKTYQDNSPEKDSPGSQKTARSRTFMAKFRPNLKLSHRARSRQPCSPDTQEPTLPNEPPRIGKTPNIESPPESVPADDSHSVVSVTRKRKADESEFREGNSNTSNIVTNTELSPLTVSSPTSDPISKHVESADSKVSGDALQSTDDSNASEDQIREAESLEQMIAEDEALYFSKPKRRRKTRRLIKSSEAPDTSKMTMKELLYYQPTSNPLPSKENQTSDLSSKPRLRLDSVQDGVDCGEDESQQSVDMAPQVMIDENGEVIINQNSLTVEAEASKPSLAYTDVTVDTDGESVTYCSFRRRPTTKYWSPVETRYFYKALSAVGTDFSLMCKMFPSRTRNDIKKKFKKEEKRNLHKVQLAMEGKLDFEHEPLQESEIEKAKEEEKERRKKLQEAKNQKVDKRKARGGRAFRTYFDVDDPTNHRISLSRQRKGFNAQQANDIRHPNNQLESGISQELFYPVYSANSINNTTIPMPGIKTMLSQDPLINKRITKLILEGTPLNQTSIMSSQPSLSTQDQLMEQTTPEPYSVTSTTSNYVCQPSVNSDTVVCNTTNSPLSYTTLVTPPRIKNAANKLAVDTTHITSSTKVQLFAENGDQLTSGYAMNML